MTKMKRALSIAVEFLKVPPSICAFLTATALWVAWAFGSDAALVVAIPFVLTGLICEAIERKPVTIVIIRKDDQ